MARLVTLRNRPHRPVALDAAIDDAVRQLEAVNARARQARGDARGRIIEELAAIDRRVIEAARQTMDAETARALSKEADAELAPFGTRLTPEARAHAAAAAFDRLLRETMGVPVIAYE